MTDRALGVGAACCGDPEKCDLGCFAEPKAPARDKKADAPVVELPEEEVDE